MTKTAFMLTHALGCHIRLGLPPTPQVFEN